MKSVFFQKLKQTLRPRKVPADVSSSPGDTRVSNSDQTVRSGGSTPVVSVGTWPENLSRPRNYRLGEKVAHGKVVAELKLTNHRDLVAKSLKALRGKVRQVKVEALVDGGATRLYLKRSVVRGLGLRNRGRSFRARPMGRADATCMSPCGLS